MNIPTSSLARGANALAERNSKIADCLAAGPATESWREWYLAEHRRNEAARQDLMRAVFEQRNHQEDDNNAA